MLLIEGPKVVLGMNWLQKLGRVSRDYAKISMEFCCAGKKVVLREDNTLRNSWVSFAQLQALVQSDGVQKVYEMMICQ